MRWIINILKDRIIYAYSFEEVRGSFIEDNMRENQLRYFGVSGQQVTRTR